MPPATYARIPSFLLFNVAAPVLSLGPVYARRDYLVRDLSTTLNARPGQLITSEAGGLDALVGTMIISDDANAEGEWSGFIERTKPREEEAGFQTTDYRVVIDLSRPAFADLLHMLQSSLPLTSVVLDFQDIDGPVEDDPLERPIPWDDVKYPLVALSSFRLRWG